MIKSILKSLHKSIFRKVVLFWILGIGLSLVTLGAAFFLAPYLVTQKSSLWFYDDKTGVIGDSIGGITGPIIGAIGAVVTFSAFYIQYQANNIQQRAIAVEQFENKYFELLRMHRENVAAISLGENLVGQLAMKTISNELNGAIKECLESKLWAKDSTKDLVSFAFDLICADLDLTSLNALVERHDKGSQSGNSQKLRQIVEKFRGNWRKGTDDNSLLGQGWRIEVYLRHFGQLVRFTQQNAIKFESREIPFFVDTIRSQLSKYESLIILAGFVGQNSLLGLMDFRTLLGVEIVNMAKEALTETIDLKFINNN